MTKDEALKMAIDAIEFEGVRDSEDYWHMMDKVRTACKEALAQPAQEPVAWINVNDKLPPQEINFLSFSEIFGYQVSMYSKNQFNSTGLPTLEKLKITKWMRIPLCTHPAHAKEWVGLSDDEIGRLAVFEGLHHVEIPLLAKFIIAIEQALKEKNHATNI